jgi:predicted metal-dependent peptidase
MKFVQADDIDPPIIELAEIRLAPIMTELASKPSNKNGITGLGGEPLVFSLISALKPIATTEVPIAATDGRWLLINPDWLLEASALTIRLTLFHEAFHAQLMHPKRRGKRKHLPWNAAVDYVAMSMILECLQHSLGSKERALKVFQEAFGNSLTFVKLDIKDAGGLYTDGWTAEPFNLQKAMKQCGLTGDLTDDEVIELRKASETFKFVFADPDLMGGQSNQKRPELIYELILPLIKNDEGLLDTHLDTIVDQSELNERLTAATYAAQQSNGYIPAAIKTELLGSLKDTTIDWYDDLQLVVASLKSDKDGEKDWTSFKRRPLSLGFLTPQIKPSMVRWACCLDTSCSMSNEQMTSVVSELQGLEGDGILVYCDQEPLWNEAIELQSVDASSLERLRVVGRRGTQLHGFINDYAEQIGEQDLLIVMTDGQLAAADVEAMKKPEMPVYWLIVGDGQFEVPFGKVYRLS